MNEEYAAKRSLQCIVVTMYTALFVFHPLQTVAVCNDEMDIMCLENCARANFDERACMLCEPTRPLLTFDGSGVDDPRALANRRRKYTEG